MTSKESGDNQGNLLVEITNFKKQVKPRDQDKKQEKKIFLKTYIIFWMVEKEFLMLLKVKYFQ